MYKKHNFKPESLSPRQKLDFSIIAEKLVPFLIIATSFVWLWK